MDVKQILERLQSRSFSLAGVTVSFFSALLITVAGLVVLLFLSMYLGWSGLAAVIFALAGACAGLLCFFFDSVKAVFGKGKTVSLGILTLYLHLMAILGFAAPDFFSELGVGRWIALTIVFFAMTWGGSYALVSYEKSSKIVAILIVGVTLFSFIPGNSLVRGIEYLGQNVLYTFDIIVYDAASQLNDPEGAIRQKYLDEYQEKVGELEKEWKRKEISAAQYEDRRRSIDRDYRQYIQKSGSDASHDEKSTGDIHIVGALVTDNVTGSGFAGRSEFFTSGERPLYYYVKYRGVVARDSSFAVQWYRNGESIRERNIVLEHEAGEILDSCRYNFKQGIYEVRLVHQHEQKNRVTFSVVDEEVVRIDNSTVVPGVARPGGMLTATVDYYLRGSHGERNVTVREKRILQHNGRPVMEPVIRDVSRPPGFNSSTAKFFLPYNVQPGNYEVVTVVSSGFEKVKTSSAFSVSGPAFSSSPPPVSASYPSVNRSGKKEMTLEQLDAVLQKVYKK